MYDTTFISDPNELKTIQVTLKGLESGEWQESAKSEFEKFISRESWKFVDRKEAKNYEKTINGCCLVFLKKEQIKYLSKILIMHCIQRLHTDTWCKL